MLKDGVVEETIISARNHGWKNEAMTGNVYPIIKKIVEGTITEDQVIQEFVKADMSLVKRQLTWFRRNPFIEWGALESCEHYLSQLLDGK